MLRHATYRGLNSQNQHIPNILQITSTQSRLFVILPEWGTFQQLKPSFILISFQTP